MVVVAAIAAFAISLLQPTVYEATGLVTLIDPQTARAAGVDVNLGADVSEHAENQARVMASPEVAQRTAELFDDGTTAQQVASAVTAAPVAGLNAVAVSASGASGESAAALVDAVVTAYQATIAEEVRRSAELAADALTASATAAQQRVASLDELLAEDPDDSVLEARSAAAVLELETLAISAVQLSTIGTLYGSGVREYSAPSIPISPIQPMPVRDAAIIAVVAVIAVGLWAWTRTDVSAEGDQRGSA